MPGMEKLDYVASDFFSPLVSEYNSLSLKAEAQPLPQSTNSEDPFHDDWLHWERVAREGFDYTEIKNSTASISSK